MNQKNKNNQQEIGKMQKPRITRGVIAIIIAITLIVLMLSGIASSFIEEKIYRIPEHIANYLVDKMAPSIQNKLTWLKEDMLLNPDPDDIKPLVDDFIDAMIPIYLMVITIISIYVLFLSLSPAGRAKAKSMIWRLILSMVLVSISLEIFKILLIISEVLTRRILAGIVTTNLAQFILAGPMNTWQAFLLFIFLIAILTCAITVVWLRYIIVLLCCAIFPFTLFLYFFEFSKDIGSKLLRYTIAAIYTPVIQALMLVITVISINSIGMTVSSDSANIVYGLLIIAGGLMIALAPLMMMGLLAWMGGAVAGAGMIVAFKSPVIGGAMVSIGGAASGMGPGAFMAGGTAYGLGRAYKRASLPAKRQEKERKREEREEKRREKREEREEKKRSKREARYGARAPYYRRGEEALADEKQRTLSDYKKRRLTGIREKASAVGKWMGESRIIGKPLKATYRAGRYAGQSVRRRATAAGRWMGERRIIGKPLKAAYRAGRYAGQSVRKRATAARAWMGRRRIIKAGKYVGRSIIKAHRAYIKGRRLRLGSRSLKGRMINKIPYSVRRKGRAVKDYFRGGKAKGAGRSMPARKSDTDAMLRAKDEKGYFSMKEKGVIKHGEITPGEKDTGKGRPTGEGEPKEEGGKYGGEYRDWEGEKRKPKEWENLDKKQEFGRAFKDKKVEEDYWKADKEIKQRKIPDVEIPKGPKIPKGSEIGSSRIDYEVPKRDAFEVPERSEREGWFRRRKKRAGSSIGGDAQSSEEST